jgi:hypothetical protein
MARLGCFRAGYRVATLLIVVAGCTYHNDSRSQAALQLIDLDDQPFDLWKQSDRVTVAVFSRSDCPISNRFAPEIRRLCESYKARGVDFYLVYVDPEESPQAIRRHLQEYQYPCEGLRDPRHALVAHCKATTTPEAAVFDRNRKLVYVGRINDLYAELGSPRPEATTHELADAIESTLARKPVATPRTKAVGCPIADLAN